MCRIKAYWPPQGLMASKASGACKAYGPMDPYADLGPNMPLGLWMCKELCFASRPFAVKGATEGLRAILGLWASIGPLARSGSNYASGAL
jgi:hypothetical protein